MSCVTIEKEEDIPTVITRPYLIKCMSDDSEEVSLFMQAVRKQYGFGSVQGQAPYQFWSREDAERELGKIDSWINHLRQNQGATS